MTENSEILNQLHAWREDIVEDIRQIVEFQSPSGDAESLQAVANFIEKKFTAIGATVEFLKNPDPSLADHVWVKWKKECEQKNQEQPKRILFLGHFDTVHDKGAFPSPFRIEGDLVYGPGIFDMKTGIIMGLYALKVIQALQLPFAAEVFGLFTTDEEVGSQTSREYIENIAKTCGAVLVLEPSAAGKVKTSRKGVGDYELIAHGRSAHAGLDHQNGVNALIELAHQMIYVQNLTDYEIGTTVSVGVAEGGSRTNVVPDRAVAKVDVRVSSMAEAHRVDQMIRNLKPVLTGASIEIKGEFNRPPMERTESVARLYQLAQAAGEELGLKIEEIGVGGGSDGNLTAGLGIPTLDGLGPVGDGAHTLHEHICLSVLPERIALLVGLLQRIAVEK